MSDSAVARVLWALERVERQLRALAEAEHSAWVADELPDGLTQAQYDERRVRRARASGHIEGIDTARLMVGQVRDEYAAKHRAVSSGVQARVLATAIEEERPATDL